jgi:hypothetical protein
VFVLPDQEVAGRAAKRGESRGKNSSARPVARPFGAISCVSLRCVSVRFRNVQARILQATPEESDLISERVLTASTLQQALGALLTEA